MPGAAAVSGSRPRARLLFLFRPRNPTRNAEAPAKPTIPMITKTLPPFFRVKVFVIMKNRFFCLDKEGLAWARRLAYLSPDPPATTSCSAPRRTATQPDPPDPGPPTYSPARPCRRTDVALVRLGPHRCDIGAAGWMVLGPVSVLRGLVRNDLRADMARYGTGGNRAGCRQFGTSSAHLKWSAKD